VKNYYSNVAMHCIATQGRSCITVSSTT